VNCTPKVGHNPTNGGAVFMTKFTITERLAAVQAVEDGESISSVAKRYQISKRVVSLSVGLYRQHGRTGLSSHTYDWTAEQKYQVLRYMHENHLSCNETSIQFGISGTATVWEWERRYLEDGIRGLENKKKGRRPKTQKPKPPLTREEELLAENEYLRAENAYLKKLNALVAEREKQENKTR
jgi:transposase